MESTFADKATNNGVCPGRRLGIIVPTLANKTRQAASESVLSIGA